MRLFGFEFKRQEEEKKDHPQSFVPKENDDGAVIVAPGGAFGTYVDLDGTVRSEAELITKYRDMSLQPEVDDAIDEIVNESIAIDEENVVEINLDKLKISEKVKDNIRAEFDNVLELLNFNHIAYETYRKWYIDGRLYYHVIVDEKNVRNGIKEVRYIDPRKIRKVKEVAKKRFVDSNAPIDATMSYTQNEYFIFSDRGFNIGNKPMGPGTTGLRIAKDSIVHVTSGLTDTSGTTVLSYLHKAIKVLNMLRTVEDSLVVYRLSRAPERRIWYIDVGNLPKVKAEQYVRDIMTKHKNKLTYDASTGEVRDDRKFMCYALDTRIPLLDGRTLTLQEIMTEYEEGKTNWVYSCDPVTGKFVPGPVSWAGVTKRDSQVVRVTFDNGKSVVCTPDHKFPVWGKGFVEAQHLVGESVIPGYRRMKEIAPGGQIYEQIFKNETKTWEFTHREVSRWKDSVGLREEFVHDDRFGQFPKRTIHHRDHYRLNNDPSNLVMMHRHDHLKYHADKARGNLRVNKSSDFTPEWRMKLSMAAKKSVRPSKTWKVTTPSGEQLVVENLSAWCRSHPEGLNRSNIKGDHGSRGYRAEVLRNHKAVSVEWLEEKIDVGCLTIDMNETYHSHHTYLLDAGVYTKNTMLEDYWLPRREGGRGTEVTTLPGGQTLGQIEDVEYFQKMLYNTLNVPVSRLNSDALFAIGNASEITRDEIKFSKFITRLRSKFSTLFVSLLEKQLVLKGIMSLEDWQSIAPHIKFDYARDSHFAELKDAEIMQNRISLYSSMKDLGILGTVYSFEWARRNVLKQTDEDIQEQDKAIEKESDDPRWHPVIGEPDMSSQQDGGQIENDSDGAQPITDEESGKLQKAMAIAGLLGKKKDRTPKEEADYHSAIQVIAKNK